MLIACFLACLGGLQALVAQGRELLFVGAAGCDGSDTACDRDSDSERKIIWTYSVTQMGDLYPVGNLSVPGTPAWLVTSPHAPGCLFVTLVDTSSVASFSITEKGANGPQALLPSGGEHPVYASVTHDGRTLLVANYHGPDDIAENDGASVAAFRIGSSCKLEAVTAVPHAGSSLLLSRQASAHAHSFVAAREGLAYACDLGQDVIVTYAVDPDGGLQELTRTRTRPGDGPRHLVQHPTRSLLFVVNELANSVSVYDEDGGSLMEVARASTLPADVSGEGNKAADLAVSPDGSKVYASNRGLHNSVCVFEVLKDGSLRQVQHVEVPAFPRGILLARDGGLLLVAGQHEGVVQTFFTAGAGKEAGLAWSGSTIKGPPTAASIAVMNLDGGASAEDTCPAGGCGEVQPAGSAPESAG